MSDPITEKELSDLLNQLKGVVQDKDRVRLIKTTSNSYNLTSNQITTLVKAQHYGDSKIQTALLMYQGCLDKQNYQQVINEFYSNEQKEIKAKLNIQ